MDKQQKRIEKVRRNIHAKQQKRAKQILKQDKFTQITMEEIEAGKRVKSYKNKILVMFGVLALVPAVWSMFLLYQMDLLEERINQMVAQKNESVLIQETAGENVEASGEKETLQEPQETNRVYITFDDGPSQNTEEILEILDQYNAKATFFVVGKSDVESKKIYNEIIAAGHTIGIHSYTHEYSQIYASLEAFQKDVMEMSDFIYDVTGVRTNLYRFPGGSANSVAATDVNELITWLDQQGYVYYDWNALSGDAVTKGLSTTTLVNNVMDGVSKNKTVPSIVLLHDLSARHNMVEALPQLLEQLQEKGYEFDQPLTQDVTPIQQKKVEDVLQQNSQKQNAAGVVESTAAQAGTTQSQTATTEYKMSK